jgi:hypothetical protein
MRAGLAPFVSLRHNFRFATPEIGAARELVGSLGQQGISRD